MRNVLTVIGVALLVLFIALIIGGAGMGWGGHMGAGMMGGFGFGGGAMLFGGLLMLVFWALIIGGVVWLAVTLSRGGQFSLGAGSANQKPLEILQARYAKGEINKDQFEEMKKTLAV
ncbi:MAG: SHOCT domain-containing protein [Chloroflexi bacterium]|nr:SHOCT domain-containing protein [Chloroflexota bacterium]